MKFCQNCGAEINENAVVCVNCGCAIAPEKKEPTPATDGMALAIKIFLIIGCIAQGWMVLPLAWCLPITISTFKKFKTGEPVGTGLKVCALLFVNTIAGILMLCRSDDK
ncbi:MAG: zinc-ribbon domain-containing protein [Ruminococcaceae bacterium]|nr:zinc-ribbon domain-containing protein [Oscillospiraceae bacterium]